MLFFSSPEQLENEFAKHEIWNVSILVSFLTTLKSKVSKLELNFNSNWKFIEPHIDSEEKTLVGLTDPIDHSSITVKITEDLPKEQISDEYYFSVIKDQMLNANSNNKLVYENEIEFKGIKFHRFVFNMHTKFGELTQTLYIHRNGKKMTSIQFGCPKTLVDNSNEYMHTKIENILNDLKL